MRRVLCFALGFAPLCAQVQVGVTGGIPLGQFFQNHASGSRSSFGQANSRPRRYTVGPFAAFRAWRMLSFEASALYKRFGFDSYSQCCFPLGPVTSIRARTNGNSWEFPLLAKARFHLLPGMEGFASAGPVIRHFGGVTQAGERTVQTIFPPPARTETTSFQTGSPADLDRRTSFGAAVGAGLAFRLARLRIAPAFRLTRWDTERTSSTISTPARLERVQPEVLLSVGYVVTPAAEAAAPRLPCCFEPGILAGVPLTAAGGPPPAYATPSSSFSTPTRRFAAGAQVDWRFHRRVSIEAGFLVRRFGGDETNAFVPYRASITGYSWEMPITLNWRPVRVGRAHVVLGAGPALRRPGAVDYLTVTAGQTFAFDTGYIARTAAGAAVLAGVEFRAGGARLRPQVRYSWFSRPVYEFPVTSLQSSVYALLVVSRAHGFN